MRPYLLVVQSDPDLQRKIGTTLREAQYELSTETEGSWAKRSLLVRAPDGVILDTTLSDGSGFGVADAIRKDPDTRHVPIIFVASRRRGAHHRSEARRRFAPAEYLNTPLDLDSLLAVVLQTIPPSSGAETLTIPDYPGSGGLLSGGAQAGQSDPAARREKREVEETVRELAALDKELRGTLARQPFARVLQRIYARRLTGALLVKRDSVKKLIYFRDGYPISVRSNLLGECLGQILLARRLISQSVLDDSLQRMQAEHKQQGAVLVEMKVLSPHNLSRALLAQMEAKLYDIFSWRTGDFSFAAGKEAPGEPVRLEKTPAALILEGIRRHYGEDRQTAVLESYVGQYVARSSDPLRRLQDLTQDPIEQRFMDRVNGSRKLEALMEGASIPPIKARLLLVAMAEAGMIERARSPVKRGMDEAQSGLTSIVGLAGRPADQISREELGAVLETLRNQSHFEVLGVGQETEAAGVDRAYEKLAREFHPDRFRFRTDDLRTVALKIFDRLGEAHLTLRDSGRKRKYLTKLDRERAAIADEVSGPIAGVPSAAADQVYFSGVDHLRAHRYHEAVQAFRRATLLAPAQANYHSALGWALYREAPTSPGAIGAGLTELRRAVEMDTQDPWLRVSLGRFYAETGRPDQAINEFQAAVGLNPGLSDIEEEIRRLRGQI